MHQPFTSEDADPGVTVRIRPLSDRFPLPRASDRCRFGQRTFAGASSNDEDAPVPDLPAPAPERAGSTRIGHPPLLLNDLVGAGEDRRGHREAKRLGSVEVDDQLESRRLLDR